MREYNKLVRHKGNQLGTMESAKWLAQENLSLLQPGSKCVARILQVSAWVRTQISLSNLHSFKIPTGGGASSRRLDDSLRGARNELLGRKGCLQLRVHPKIIALQEGGWRRGLGS